MKGGQEQRIDDGKEPEISDEDASIAVAVAVLADELLSAGLPLCSAGVLAGGMSAIERAAVEAISAAIGARAGDPALLFEARLRAQGLTDVADAVRGEEGRPLVRAVLTALCRVTGRPLARGAPTASSKHMDGARNSSFTIDSRVSIGAIEAEIARLSADEQATGYALRMTPDERSGLLKEIWTAMLVAAATAKPIPVIVSASGVTAWPDLDAREFDDDDATALSIPVLQALQTGAHVVPARAGGDPLRAASVRGFTAQRRGGVLGRSGRTRRIVEFDPQDPVAPRLGRGSENGRRFEGLILEAMTAFEVGARVRGASPVREGPRQAIVTFLTELHVNAYRYARSAVGVRVVRIGKNILDEESAVRRAGDFPGMREFLAALRLGRFNLIEASVSDFGPGLLDGFLSSDPGRAFADKPRGEIIVRILHEQLSSNGGDPNAGLGTIRALEAAMSVGGFVSLRTGEHWLVMSGHESGPAEMRAVPGPHAKVVGTHWTLLYPDPLR